MLAFANNEKRSQNIKRKVLGFKIPILNNLAFLTVIDVLYLDLFLKNNSRNKKL